MDLLIEKEDVFLYKISGEKEKQGAESVHRAADWDLSNPSWCGQLVIYSIITGSDSSSVTLKLKDAKGTYGRAVIKDPGTDLVPVKDSSRYFTLEVGFGKRSPKLVGIGFSNREDSEEVVKVLTDYFDSTSANKRKLDLSAEKKRREAEAQPAKKTKLVKETVRSPPKESTKESKDSQECRPIVIKKLEADQFYPPDIILAQTNDPEYKYISGDVFQCHICTQAFSSPQNIRLHWLQSHDLSQALTCKCRLPFPNKKERVLHENRFHPSPFHCKKCLRRFESEDELAEHMLEKHGAKAKAEAKARVKAKASKNTTVPTFDCSQCGKCLPSKTQLRKHEDAHHRRQAAENSRERLEESREARENRYVREAAERREREEQRVRERDHVREREMKIDFEEESSKRRGEERIPGYKYIRGNRFLCHKCPSEFEDLIYFESHWKVTHWIDTVSNCITCKLPFPNVGEMVEHRQSVHGSPCPAPACGKVFTLEEGLRDHVSTCHGQQVVFTCSGCGDAFEQKGHLLLHIERVHESPSNRILHECGQCGEKFLSGYDLNGHLLTHLLNYFCDRCDAVFKYSWVMHSHYQQCHGGASMPSNAKVGIVYPNSC